MILSYSKINVIDDNSNDNDISDINIDTNNSKIIIIFKNITKQLLLFLSSIILLLITNINIIQIPSSIVHAKDTTSTTSSTIPSLEKCFNAIEKELSDDGDSLRRIDKDISTEDWTDLKLFTREYDAGFRGGVLKVAWKQLKGMMTMIVVIVMMAMMIVMMMMRMAIMILVIVMMIRMAMMMMIVVMVMMMSLTMMMMMMTMIEMIIIILPYR